MTPEERDAEAARFMERARTCPLGDFQRVMREELDPEYADVDEAGQLALGIAGEQRAIPGLAKPRTYGEQ